MKDLRSIEDMDRENLPEGLYEAVHTAVSGKSQ